jgi:hypothetical protein
MALRKAFHGALPSDLPLVVENDWKTAIVALRRSATAL